MNLVETAIDPIKQQTIDYVVGQFQRRIDWTLQQLEEAGWELNAAFPRPKSNMSRGEYKDAEGRRNFAKALTVRDPNWQPTYRMDEPEPRVRSQDAIDHQLKVARQMAAESFEAYAAKLTEKIGLDDVATVELDDTFRNLWSYSFLHVTRKDGSKEKWKTQIITKVSCLGTVFNQWPTRKVK